MRPAITLLLLALVTLVAAAGFVVSPNVATPPTLGNYDNLTNWNNVNLTNTPTTGQVPTATSTTTAAWQTPAAGGSAVVSNSWLTADQATTSATAVNMTGMSFPISANEVWTAEFNLLLTAAASGDQTKIAVTVPSGATVLGMAKGTGTTVNSPILTSGDLTSVAVWGGSGTNAAQVNLYVANGANAGTVQLQFAVGDGSGTTTAKIGSYMTARRVSP